MTWIFTMRDSGRVEYLCEHDVGHGLHVHGCDGCCQRKDFPLRNHKHKYALLGLMKEGKTQEYCSGCGKMRYRRPKK